jgi:CRISPR-associated endonuclease Csn1
MESYVLGLDLGSASIGWAIVEPNKKVIDCGVRIFDPGVNLEMFNKGQEGSSNNLVRRMARLHRRQLRRRAARQRDLFELLQQHSLLPGTATRDSQQRHDILQQLDSDLRAAWSDRLTVAGVPEQSLIYLLRKQALDARLEPFELGRVLYHLAQRRGFKSNRRDTAAVGAADGSKAKPGKTKDEASVVKDGIKELRAEMDAAGSRTLGEHFATLSAASQIVRRHWTDRKWFIEEFEAIWQAQVLHHGALTPDLKQQVFRLLFFQRPIATNAHLIGKCELEPGEYRAPMANLLAQRFRYLQKLNDLAIDDVPKTRPITSEQRAILLTAFECKPDLTFDAIRKLLGFDKSVRFNLERGGEKKLPGNRGEIRANCKNRPLRKRVRGTSGELSSGPLRNFRR